MRLKDNATNLERYKEYLKCTENLDNTPKDIKLKQAVWNSIFKLYKRKSPSEILKEAIDNEQKEK